MLDDHVVRLDRETSSYQSDAGIGSGLSGQSEPRVPHVDRFSLQIDHSTDFEDHEPRASILERRSERAGTAVGESGDAEHRPVEPSDRHRSLVDWYYHFRQSTHGLFVIARSALRSLLSDRASENGDGEGCDREPAIR